MAVDKDTSSPAHYYAENWKKVRDEVKATVLPQIKIPDELAEKMKMYNIKIESLLL